RAYAARRAALILRLLRLLRSWASGSSFSGELRASGVPIARDEMVVDHADGLHERVDDGRPDEFKTACDKFLRYFLGQCRLCRHLSGRTETVELRLAVEMIPEQIRKSRPALHDFKPGACGRDRSLDFCPIADNAGILHQRFDLSLRIARDFFRRKVIK